jgi:hypothetical protein
MTKPDWAKEAAEEFAKLEADFNAKFGRFIIYKDVASADDIIGAIALAKNLRKELEAADLLKDINNTTLTQFERTMGALRGKSNLILKYAGTALKYLPLLIVIVSINSAAANDQLSNVHIAYEQAIFSAGTSDQEERIRNLADEVDRYLAIVCADEILRKLLLEYFYSVMFRPR